jgi:succinate-semialdehyde dehydrogenase/glutarate-semialdehyde dehydrogenase
MRLAFRRVSTGDIARELTANSTVRKLAFAGSIEIGYRLQRAGADTPTKITTDRGGRAALLVFDDADLDAAVQGALLSTFRSTAQPGIAVNRFLIQRGIYDAFAAQYAAAAQALQVGPGIEPTVEVGPLIDEAAVRAVEGRIADAVAQGAMVVTGGRRHARGGRFFEPTVLGHATARMQIARAESCGVVAPLIQFGIEEEALALANDSDLGLASYFFTRDAGRVYRVAQGLATAVLGVNAVALSAKAVPFGGIRRSGPGPKGNHDGIRDFLETRYIYFAEASH